MHRRYRKRASSDLLRKRDLDHAQLGARRYGQGFGLVAGRERDLGATEAEVLLEGIAMLADLKLSRGIDVAIPRQISPITRAIKSGF
jgi:hypothetical protein